jgi:hypothetical protein
LHGAECPACGGPLLPEPPHVLPNGRWQCTACFELVDGDGVMLNPRRLAREVFRVGEVWRDRRGRRHRVFRSEVPGLLLLAAMDHQLAPETRRPADVQGWAKDG